MQTVIKFMGTLKLKFNQEKSAVAKARERKFLGYRLWILPKKIVRRAVTPQSLFKFKELLSARRYRRSFEN